MPAARVAPSSASPRTAEPEPWGEVRCPQTRRRGRGLFSPPARWCGFPVPQGEAWGILNFRQDSRGSRAPHGWEPSFSWAKLPPRCHRAKMEPGGPDTAWSPWDRVPVPQVTSESRGCLGTPRVQGLEASLGGRHPQGARPPGQLRGSQRSPSWATLCPEALAGQDEVEGPPHRPPAGPRAGSGH